MIVHQLAHVAVDAPIHDILTYHQNPEFTVQRGDVVLVPLGKRRVLGVVISTSEQTTNPEIEEAASAKKFSIKAIISLDEEWPRLSDHFLKWLEWVSDYYMHPIGLTTQLCFPSLRKIAKERKSSRPSVVPENQKRIFRHLTDEQNNCVAAIQAVSGFATHLVHGVTGSGKTEVYLQLFEKVLAENKKGLFLLPEISLTPQLIQRFAERFPDQIAVLHSQLTDRERTNQWWQIVENKKNILIGARSALFCPIDSLGLIVVDEEHESSFKQDEKLKYNGRDCAIMLGRYSNCPVVLGSATPSLESWHNAQLGKYHLHQLKKRVQDRPLPSIEVVDMRLEKENEKKKQNTPFWLSENLYQSMQNSLSQNEQVALLLNRRGMAHMLFCPSCGYSVECPNCDISLTLHANSHLVCHYCDYHENIKSKCPDCKEGELTTIGLGTEKVEEDLKILFPHAVIARADRDEIQTRAQLEEVIQKMENNEIQILIGTQMIAKGLDFTNLKLVGLLLADISFNLPDFRASEKSFQLITQMSGRSGRHVALDEAPGKVIIQTYNTEHESIVYAQAHDYEGFAQKELGYRQQLNYPPFHKLAAIRIQSTDLERAKQTASQFAHRGRALQQKYAAFNQIELLGPAVAPIAKLRNQFRFHILLKNSQSQILNQFIKRIMHDSKWVPPQTKIVIDIDPINLL